VLVHLTLEAEAGTSDDAKVLVHLGARHPRATTDDQLEAKVRRKTNFSQALRGMGATSMSALEASNEDDSFIHDLRVVTILCKQNDYWFPSVLHHVQQTFHWGEAAMQRLHERCAFEALFVPAEDSASPTICHEHMHACGDYLALVYDTIYLRVKIPGNCCGTMEGIVGPPPSGEGTSEEETSLNSFPGSHNLTGPGVVGRCWKWMPKRDATVKGVEGLEPPEDARAQVLHLERQETRVASILLGIESSAPLKDDFFGMQHGVSARSKDFSSFGRRKWRDFRRGGIKVPADLGGVQVLITKKLFEEAMRHCADMNLSVPHENSSGVKEREFFQKLLQGNSANATAMLENADKITSSSLKSVRTLRTMRTKLR